MLGCLMTTCIYAQQITPYNWQMPKYGSHTLREVKHIAGQKFIAAGDEGMILLSDDDGLNWTMNQQPTIVDFKTIFVKDSLTYFVGGSQDNGDSRIFITMDGGQIWTEVFALMNMQLNDLHFANDSIGYAVGNPGKLIKTIDGGQTWMDFSSASLTGNLQSVYFLNSDTGFVGKNTTTNAMFRTSNGGLTWSQVFGYSGNACYTITFVNDTLGYAGAYNSRIFKTVNAGNTWAQQTTFQTNEAVRNISFANKDTGIAVTNSYVYRTSNGTNWTGPFLNGFNFHSCAISPTGTAILGDNYGGIHRNNNFSNTYTKINPESGFSVFSKIKFADNNNGWVVGEGYNIWKTSNGGSSWTNMNTNNYIDYTLGMAVISSTKVVILSGNGVGKVLTTSNGGSTFIEQTLSPNNTLNAISFPTSNVGYIVGNNGTAFKTTNGGSAYSPISTGITNHLVDVFFVDAQNGFVLGEFGTLRKTIDGGLSWTTIPISGLGTFKKIWFTDLNNGYAINTVGECFRSIDGGNSFLPAGQTCIQNVFDVQFINDSTGFVVGSFTNASCDVAYTTNYGASWQSMLFPYAYAGWGVFAFDTANVFLVGQHQTIISTGNGSIITGLNNSEEVKSNTFLIYPNPAIKNLSIELTSEPLKISRAKIFNSTGQLVIDAVINSRIESLYLNDLSPGLYFLSIEDGNERKVQRFQILKE
jgi:photosystem II stability/assembly factor-like uncharacterized protein